MEGSARLCDGDVITIGDATIRCRVGGRRDEPTRTLELRRGSAALAGAPLDASANGASGRAAPSGVGTQDALQVDANTHEVLVGDRPLPRRLSAQEFQLLSYLFEHRQRVCTRQELGDAIWGRDRWDPNMLHRLVHRLKEKLEPDPTKPRYVQTMPWVGYRVTP
jgi:DNA-binding response OmpR family regulator